MEASSASHGGVAKALHDPIRRSPLSITQPIDQRLEASIPEISLPQALSCSLNATAADLGAPFSMANAVTDEQCVLESLPEELLAIVTENLDTHCLACYAAACHACLAAAQDELHARAALLAVVKRCLEPGGVGALAAWCIGGMDALVSRPHFRLPNDLVTIPSRAFAGCTSLTQLRLPATVTTIGDGAFAGCRSLTKLTIPTDAALTKIGSRSFKGTALTSIVLPAGLTSIGVRAFGHCKALTSIALPASLTTFGSSAFHKCTSLNAATRGQINAINPLLDISDSESDDSDS